MPGRLMFGSCPMRISRMAKLNPCGLLANPCSLSLFWSRSIAGAHWRSCFSSSPSSLVPRWGRRTHRRDWLAHRPGPCLTLRCPKLIWVESFYFHFNSACEMPVSFPETINSIASSPILCPASKGFHLLTGLTLSKPKLCSFSSKLRSCRRAGACFNSLPSHFSLAPQPRDLFGSVAVHRDSWWSFSYCWAGIHA